LFATTSLAVSTGAGARDLGEGQSAEYYAVNGSITAAGFAGSWLVRAASGDHVGRYDLPDFHFDGLARLNSSHAAAALSDRFLWLTLSVPVVGQASDGFDTRFGNSMLVYGEVLSVNVFLTTVTKELVRRPRPYTHRRGWNDQPYPNWAGSEAYVSFFSGHSSSAHAAAASGSILYSGRGNAVWTRYAMWGFEFGAAGITARLRVRAGRHYPTDVWAGALIGTGLGIAIPALHGIDLSQIHAWEWGAGGIAMGTTFIVSELVDFCDMLGPIGPCDLPPDDPIPPGAPEPSHMQIGPMPLPGGAGLSASGTF
jgi:membrane-associated phospholipid phosphatase